jgi:hypothetical protein
MFSEKNRSWGILFSLMVFATFLVMPVEQACAAIEPNQRPDTYYISGTLQPSYARIYGPYTACIAIQVYVTWTPTDQALWIGITDPAHWPNFTGPPGPFIGGYAYCGFGNLQTSNSYYIMILSWPTNTKSLTYSGRIVVWRPY